MRTFVNKLEGMRNEASNHQEQMQEIVTELTELEGLDSSRNGKRNRVKSYKDNENVS